MVGIMKMKPVSMKAVDFTSDRALTTAAAAGRRTARRELANRLFDRVRTTISYLAPGQEVEDLCQTALIQILKAADGYRGESSLEFWADRVAIRCVLRFFEKNKRRRQLAEENPYFTPHIISTEEQVERLRARRRLSTHLQELTGEQSVAMVLHYLHGYKIEEIADMMESPVNTVRGRLRAGRKKMRQRILSDPVLSDWMEGRG
jgi:RNA polymerase sigma-70 factor, ECF subfamily